MAVCCTKISFEQKIVSRSKQGEAMVFTLQWSCGTLLGLMLGDDYCCQPEPRVSGVEVSKYSDCNI